MTETRATSGRVALTNDCLRYESQDYGSCSVQVSDIKIIGEFTNDHGPMLDDWFLVLVTNNSGWFELSMYAEGIKSLREQLGVVLQADLGATLYHSTEFASRIMWPAELKDQTLFTFSPVKLSWWQKLLRLGGGQVQTYLSTQVQQYFASLEQKHSNQTGRKHE